MCCNTTMVCSNPLNKINHTRAVDVLPVTQYEREHYRPHLEDATHICSLCRLQLTRTLPDEQLDDYWLLVDVLNRMTNFDEDEDQDRPTIVRRIGGFNVTQQGSRAILAESDNNTQEKSALNGIDMLLAAAELIDDNDTNRTRNGYQGRLISRRTGRRSS